MQLFEQSKTIASYGFIIHIDHYLVEEGINRSLEGSQIKENSLILTFFKLKE